MEIEIAQRIVDQWDNHGKFRTNESSLWANGMEPDEVVVSRALLKAKIKPMKFNHGELSQDGWMSGLVIVFDNGLVLKSESVLWMSEAEQAAVQAKFTEVIEALNGGSFEYSTEIGN